MVPDQFIWYQIKLAVIVVPAPEFRVFMKGLALKDTIKLPLVCGLAARGAKIIFCQPLLRRQPVFFLAMIGVYAYASHAHTLMRNVCTVF
jgi:hypothetical protein